MFNPTPLGCFFVISLFFTGGWGLVSYVELPEIPLDPTPPRIRPARLPTRAPVPRYAFRSRATWG